MTVSEFLQTCNRHDAMLSTVRALHAAFGGLKPEEFEKQLRAAGIKIARHGLAEPLALGIAPPDHFWSERGGWLEMLKSDGT